MELWPSIHGLDASRVSNSYLVIGPPLTLVDTGPPGALPRLLAAIRRAGVRPADLQRIVLTHLDVDHIGGAHALQCIADAEVCAHEKDIPYITAERPFPGPLMRRAIGATWGRRLSSPRVDRVLHDGDHLGPLTVVHLPGHTPGHVGLQQGPVFLAGDAVFGGRRLRQAPGILTWDIDSARRSIGRMASLDIELLLPGHGTPVNDGSRRCAELIADKR